MPLLFILIRKKTSKRFLGAVPVKKGTSVKRIRNTLRKSLKPGISARIVTKSTLERVILAQRPKGKKGLKRRFRRKKKR